LLSKRQRYAGEAVVIDRRCQVLRRDRGALAHDDHHLKGHGDAAVAPPLDPFQPGALDLLGAAPGSAAFDQFGLEQPVDGLGEGVIEAVPAAATKPVMPSSANRSV